MKNKYNSWLCLLLLLGFVLLACSQNNNIVSKDETTFQITIIDKDVVRPEDLGQTWEAVWPVLQESYQSNTNYTFSQDDIQVYDWKNQIIVLTSQASRRFLNESTIVLDHKNLGYLFGCTFVVTYGNAPVYGGIFLQDYPFERAYQYPVIYPSISNEQIAFKIRPYRMAFEIDLKEPEWEKITDERIETLFEQNGKLIR